eukprot:14341-Heterococcus_DN1.PRE.2
MIATTRTEPVRLALSYPPINANTCRTDQVAAHESRYFDDNGNLIRFPLRELQLDCKGNVIMNIIEGTVEIGLQARQCMQL